jgi:hypothetical protein
LCKTREFGVGNALNIPGITSWEEEISEQPVNYIQIDGSKETIRITDIRDLREYKRFLNMCSLYAGRYDFMPVVSEATWSKALNEASKLKVARTATEDVSLKGRIKEHLGNYLRIHTSTGTSRLELDLGKVYEDGNSDRVYFKLKGFMEYLERAAKMRISEQLVSEILRNHIGAKFQDNLRITKEDIDEDAKRGPSIYGPKKQIKDRIRNVWWVSLNTFEEHPPIAVPPLPAEKL